MSKSHHAMPFGAELTTKGVRFAIWAPSARKVLLDYRHGTGLSADITIQRLMTARRDGWYTVTVPEAKAGGLYGFVIDGGGDPVPDPASRYQPGDDSRYSQIIDPLAFAWTDLAWNGRPWEEAVIYEAHMGTVTPDGTFAALIDKLDHLAATGITALELMPIAETPGSRTWGYDGVLPFAVNNSYGTPDDLKHLIDAAHSKGIMILLDVVYNHFGPSGNFLHGYAADFFTDRHQTPWGAGINFDGGGEAWPVREFFIHNALFWLEEYHVDGLRFDAVHAIQDNSNVHFLDELARRVRTALPGRKIHLILENELNEAHRLVRDASGAPVSFDAQWDDDLHHCWHRLLTGEKEGYYADFGGDTVERLGRCLAEGFAYQGDYSAHLGRTRGEATAGVPPQAFVACLQNHDQIGNRAQGERLAVLADPSRLGLARAGLLLAPQIPMLFMGEDWGSQAPFQFFIGFDQDDALKQAVREGRAREFAHFESFKDAGVPIPDPASEATFRASKLNWGDMTIEPFRSILAETKALLALRRIWIVPLLKSGFLAAKYDRQGPGGLEAVWAFEAGTLRLFLNFEGPEINVTLVERETIIWSSGATSGADKPSLGAWQGVMTLIPAAPHLQDS